MNISQLLVRLRLDNSQFDSGLAKSTGGLRALDTEAKGMQSAMQFAGVAGVAFMAKQAAGAVFDLAKLAAEADRTVESFDELARQAGGSSTAILSAIKRATDGTVSDMDAMQAANRGILLGLGANADQWEKLTEVARFRARAMGITVTQALNDIATGIGRESRLILDNLGIILDMDRVLSDYGATVGRTADDLTVYERKQAIMTSVIADGQAQIQAAGGIARDAVDDFESLDAAIENLKVSFGGLIDEPMAEFTGQVAGTTDNLSDFAALMDAVGRGALTLGEALGAMGRQKNIASTEGEEAAHQYVQDIIRSGEEVWRVADALDDFKAAQDRVAEAEEFGSPEQLEYYKEKLREARAAYLEMAQVLPTVTQQQDAFLAGVTGGAGAMGSAEQQAQQLAAELERSESAVTGLAGAFQTSKPAALEYAETLAAVGQALRDVKADIAGVSAEEVGIGFSGAADQMSARLSRLAGTIDLAGAQSIYDRYLGQLEDLYNDVAAETARGTDVTELELDFRRQAILNSFDEELGILEGAQGDQAGVLRGMASQYNELRGAVTSALQPTAVTGLDMQLAGLGEYVDKWDESARRLDAIAARGFSELEAHPDWAAALAIPDDVLAGGEAALKDWAKRASDDVRNLFRPDLIDIGAAADAVEKYLQDQAAKEVTIDLVVKELQTRGVSEDEARKQVLSMYGLEEELPVSLGLAEEAVENLKLEIGTPEIPVTLTSATGAGFGEEGGGEEGEGLDLITTSLQNVEDRTEDLYSAGSLIIETLAQGAEAAAGTMAIGGTFVATLAKDLKARTNDLRMLGDQLWGIVEAGFRAALADAGIMDAIADELTPFIMARLKSNQAYESGSGQP